MKSRHATLLLLALASCGGNEFGADTAGRAAAQGPDAQEASTQEDGSVPTPDGAEPDAADAAEAASEAGDAATELAQDATTEPEADAGQDVAPEAVQPEPGPEPVGLEPEPELQPEPGPEPVPEAGPEPTTDGPVDVAAEKVTPACSATVCESYHGQCVSETLCVTTWATTQNACLGWCLQVYWDGIATWDTSTHTCTCQF